VSNDNASVNPFLKGNLEFARRLWTSKLEKSTFDQFIASAFEGKDSEMLQYFLDNGADPNASMTDGTTLLTTAVAQNDTESVRLLLEHKADADAPDNLGICPVMKVADSESGNLEILKLLLDHGADPNGRIPKEERPTIRTPLAAAWFHHRQDMMELLVEKGANVNFQSFDGHTLLMWAATGGAYDLVQFLLAHGADPSIKNDAGVTAHHYAEVSPQPDPRIKELLK